LNSSIICCFSIEKAKVPIILVIRLINKQYVI
jgi:hypothetical protein